MKIRLDDFIMLGKTVARRDSKGRVTVCSLGYSQSIRDKFGWGLIRIYPLSHVNAPKDLRRYSVMLEPNPTDNRHESWRLAANPSPDHHERINNLFLDLGPANLENLRNEINEHMVSGISSANEAKRSAAFVRPKAHRLYTRPVTEAQLDQQGLLFGSREQSNDPYKSGAIPIEARIKFDDDEGRHNDLSYSEWGASELIRKGYDSVDQIEKATHLNLPSRIFLIGNHWRNRTAWVVVKSFGLSDQLVLTGGDVPQGVRMFVIDRDNGQCQRCGSVDDLHVDHVVPRCVGRGGSSEPDNLQVLCRTCNLSKGTDIADYRSAA
jgi:hypothetical protein